MLEYEAEGYSGTKQGRIFGQCQKKTGGHLIFGGGPGYTIDRIGLKKLSKHFRCIGIHIDLDPVEI